jgi:hypothetical protein
MKTRTILIMVEIMWDIIGRRMMFRGIEKQPLLKEPQGWWLG